MRETPTTPGAVENPDLYQFGVERDGCLGNTVASMVSTISGQEYNLPPIYYHWRGAMIQDELRAFRRHIRRNSDKSSEELELALHRLDQRVFKKVLQAIKENNVGLLSAIPIAMILEDCEIKYRKGGFINILEVVNDGYQVAVMYETPKDEDLKGEKWWHMAHVGIGKDNRIVRLSDNNAPITDSTILAIDESARYLNREARTWNFVALKSRF